MKKHSPKSRRSALRRQGTIIFAMIVAVSVCIFVILGLIIADQLSGKSDVSNTSLSSDIPGSESISSQLSSDTETTSASSTATPETSAGSIETGDPTVTTQDNGTTATLPKNITGPDLTGYVVVLDPGHQQKPNRAQEPLSPTMSGSKDKV